ncbi:MAG: enoyl-CoA hydratase-related protein [Acidimicrobiia bacterium]|nr:enoyl-CoA hydratase-related protein [Acidimicrobiia bacterium]MDH5420588.1 enoyl-CoA hydratase-related protein [Acidimicrobiia bacterium]MDH5504460.1 enoyl-CoA hydratase-related protein [Acidimicrobiia bacterium]
MNDGITTEWAAPIMTMTINRGKANAIDAATSRKMGASFERFRDNPDYRVAIVTGAGDRFFSAGWDLKAAAEGEAYEADNGPGGFGGFPELADLRKPVIVAVNGLAVGGGFEMVLAADLVVASDHVEFMLPEALAGIVPDVGLIRLPKLLPKALATEILMGSRRLSAHEALQFGLINRVVGANELMHAAHELAAAVIAAAPLSVAAILEAMSQAETTRTPDALTELRAGSYPLYKRVLESADAAEGIAAFNEKRAPRWQGK